MARVLYFDGHNDGHNRSRHDLGAEVMTGSGLYIGSLRTANDWSWLRAHNIRYIINLSRCGVVAPPSVRVHNYDARDENVDLHLGIGADNGDRLNGDRSRSVDDLEAGVISGNNHRLLSERAENRLILWRAAACIEFCLGRAAVDTQSQIGQESICAMDEASREILAASRIPVGVLVNCAAGVNRSACAIALYLVRKKYSVDAVMTALRDANAYRRRPVLTNESFVRYILSSVNWSIND